MRKITFSLLLISLCAAMLVSGCRRREATDPSTITETIAPAAAKPDTTGTDAMTQTVDIEDSRSEAEGGVITTPNPPVRARTAVAPPPPPPTTTTTTTATTTARPAAKKKRRP